jgi:hypothetical protein
VTADSIDEPEEEPDGWGFDKWANWLGHSEHELVTVRHPSALWVMFLEDNLLAATEAVPA